MTCKDCIHNGLCYKENDYENFPDRCGEFISDKVLEERPQGEWKHMTVGNTNIEFIICSNCSCGCPSYSYIKEGETEEKVQLCETTFCPNCGADMRGARK